MQTSTEATHKLKRPPTSQNGPSRTVEPLEQSMPTSQATTHCRTCDTYNRMFPNCAETVTHRSFVIRGQSQAVLGRNLLIPPDRLVRFHAGYPGI